MPKKADETKEVKKATVKKEVAEKTEKVTEKKVTKKETKAKNPNTVGVINITGKPGELIKKYQRTAEDTGSTEVQIALFTAKIDQLSKHLKKHNKDSDSKRGILIMVGKRRRLLTFLKKNNAERYASLIADLGLRK